MPKGAFALDAEAQGERQLALMASRPTIFVSYSHVDSAWKDRLLRHLAVLELHGLVDVWDEGRIAAGNDWRSEIEAAIAGARLAVLLISADFLGSALLAEEVVPWLLSRHACDRLHLLPILLRPCDWKAVAWLAPLRVLPRDEHAVAAGTDAQIDADFAALTTEIRGILGRASRSTVPAPLSTGPLALHEGPGGLPITAVPHFIGRDEEMRELRALLAGGTAVCLVATGLGGIGKTTLARQFVATEARAMFPDGSVWIDAMNIDADAVRAATRFGLRAERRPTVAEAARFLAMALHNKRALVIIDNVPSTIIDPKTLPIVEGMSRTMITSRAIGLHELLDRPARSLPIRRWSKETCRSYMRGVVPTLTKASDKDVDAIALFVDRLPLAVRLLARLLMRPGMTPTGLLERLKKEPLGMLDKVATSADRGVAATFKASYEGLDDTQRRILVALAACARVTSESMVALVAGLGDNETADGLADLAERSLVDNVDCEARLWTLHDVVRLFVREQDGVRRADDAHLAFAEQHVSAHQDPLDWQAMEAGMDEVLAAMDRLLQAGDAQRAANLMDRAYPHMKQRGRNGELIERYEKLVARLPGGTEALALGLGRLGWCYETLGDHAKAIEHIQRSLAIEERLGRLEGQAINLNWLGVCFREYGDLPKAIEYHQRSLGIEEELGRLEGQANSLGNIGLCYLALNVIPKAIEHHQRSLAIEQKLGRLVGQAIDLSNLGRCYRVQGDLPKAIEHLQHSLTLNEKLGRLEGQADALRNLGMCFLDHGDFSLARSHLNRAHAIERQIGLPDHHPDVHRTRYALAVLETSEAARRG